MAHAAFGLINSTPAQRPAARPADARGAPPDGARRAQLSGSSSSRAAYSAASTAASRSRSSSVDGLLATRVQPGEQLVARQAAQLEQHERVGLDQPGELLEHGERVRARLGPGLAGAGRPTAHCRRAAARPRPRRRARPGRAAGRRRAARRSGRPPPRRVSTTRRDGGLVEHRDRAVDRPEPALVLDRRDEAARARWRSGRRARRGPASAPPRRSASANAASSTARTHALPHQVVARVVERRGATRGWRIVMDPRVRRPDAARRSRAARRCRAR